MQKHIEFLKIENIFCPIRRYIYNIIDDLFLKTQFHNQDDYKSKVKNDRKKFEIHAVFILWTRNSRVGKHIFFNFPLYFMLDFFVHKIKEKEFQKSFCHSLPLFLYIPGIQHLLQYYIDFVFFKNLNWNAHIFM